MFFVFMRMVVMIVIVRMVVIIIVRMVIIIIVRMVVIIIVRMVVIIIVRMVVIIIVRMVVMIVIVRVVVIIFMRMVVMIIIVRVVVMVVVVIMSMFVMMIVRARGTNIDARGGDNDVDICAGIFYRFQQGFFIANAVDEDQIGVGDSRQVTGTGDEVVRVAARRDERADIEVVAGDNARHIRQDAVGRNHDRFGRLCANIDAKKQHQHCQNDNSIFHACSSLMIHCLICIVCEEECRRKTQSPCTICCMNADRVRRILLLLIIAFCCGALFVTGGLLAAALLRWADGGAIVAELTPVTQRTIRIIDAGQARQLQTALHEPLPILDRAGISLGEKDKVWINGALANQESLPDWTVPALQIEIRRAVQLRILDDGAEIAILSAAKTIGEALDEAGIELGASDAISRPLATRLDEDIDLRITRGLSVRVLVDGEVIEARTQSKRVVDLLDELGLSLGSLDFTRPAVDEWLGDDAEIQVVRVLVEELVEREEIPPGAAQYRPDADTPLDRSSVIQAAQPGLRETITRVRYENGREVSRETGEPQLVQQPQNQIIGYGTKAVVLGTVNTPGGPREYWRVLCMYATSYNPRSNNGNTLTAIGETLRTGIVASDPDLIAYRSEVFVAGYGVGYMADTAGYRSSPYWIDLGFSDADYTRDWHEYAKVYLLTPVPAKVNPLLPAWRPIRSVPGGCN